MAKYRVPKTHYRPGVSTKAQRARKENGLLQPAIPLPGTHGYHPRSRQQATAHGSRPTTGTPQPDLATRCSRCGDALYRVYAGPNGGDEEAFWCLGCGAWQY